LELLCAALSNTEGSQRGADLPLQPLENKRRHTAGSGEELPRGAFEIRDKGREWRANGLKGLRHEARE